MTPTGTPEIDWEALARRLGSIHEGGESGSDRLAREAVALILGDACLERAVDHYVAGAPGFELARSVLWLLRPRAAMERCRSIARSKAPSHERASAVELLRVVADERALPWVQEFMRDEDGDVARWGFLILVQLFHAGLADAEALEPLLLEAEQHADPYVRAQAATLKERLHS